MAGGGKLVSHLDQMLKIQKGISYFKKARTMLANSHLGMLARESYGATKDFFTSRFGSLWDDFSRTKFSFAGLDDFRYADDMGKHTARLYQSTSEGAEYQRLRRALYSEAAEHGDDVAKVFKETIEQAHPEVHWEGHKWESHLEELHKKMLADNVPVTAEVHTVEEIAKQQAEILKVRYGEEALSSSLKKGNFGEMVQDEYYRQFGYERISKDMVTGLDDAGRKGIDGVYYNPNGHPPYIISEAKYNKAKLSKGLADGTDQMDLEWINNRLDRAVSEEHLAAIQDAMEFGDVQSHLFKSITFDCGKEFSKWKSISNAHDIDIFFADPGCPGQRGLNEHSNGLLRRNGLPKQMDFTNISQNYLSAIADKRNKIPRKSLNYQTPYQVFLSYLKSLT